MKGIFRNSRFRLVLSIIALLLTGALLAAAGGHGETAQSAVVGTVAAPFHFVAKKISNGLDKLSGNVSGDAAYEKKIASLQEEISDLQSQLVDYENLKNQNELYKDFLELKEDNPHYQFEEASVVARDSADLYQSFTISKGTVNGVKDGNAVLYKKNLVGVVEKAYPDYSVVRTILDPEFNVSAYEIVSGEISYVTGNAKLAKNGKCKMANLSASTDIPTAPLSVRRGSAERFPRAW